MLSVDFGTVSLEHLRQSLVNFLPNRVNRSLHLEPEKFSSVHVTPQLKSSTHFGNIKLIHYERHFIENFHITSVS